MAWTDPLATSGQLRPLDSGPVRPEEADNYPFAAPLASEISTMPDGIRDPEFVMHEQHLRLECLKIAVASVDPEDVARPAAEHLVAQAELLSRFVIGTTNG